MKIAITPRSFQQAGAQALQMLREKGFELELNTTGNVLGEDGMALICQGADGLIVGVDPVTERLLRANPQLRAISKYGSGLDNIDLDAAARLGVSVMNAGSANAKSVAELAVGLMFSLARSIPFAAASTKAGRWDRKTGSELFGKTAGIVGLGNIGRETARIARGIGMDVIACDPYVQSGNLAVVSLGISQVPFEELFARADFVTLHLPLTPETRHMIGMDALMRMKSAAFLINAARGELVDEEALYSALASGKIAGAAADVLSAEPPPKDHPLLSLDNFILTPHIGMLTKEAVLRTAMTAAENVVEMLSKNRRER